MLYYYMYNSALDLEAALREKLDRFRVGLVFLHQHASGEGLGGIAFLYGHALLDDDRAGIVVLVNEVDGAAGNLDAAIDRRLMYMAAVHAFAAEQRNKAWVDVHHTPAICADHVRRQYPHVTRETDEIGLVLVQNFYKARGILGVRRESFRTDLYRRDAVLASPIHSGGVALGTDHHCNTAVNPAVLARVYDRLEIAPTTVARYKNSYVD